MEQIPRRPCGILHSFSCPVVFTSMTTLRKHGNRNIGLWYITCLSWHGIFFALLTTAVSRNSDTKWPHMSRFGLCWRCTQSGTSSDPDVVLLRWVFWVQGDLILIYYWGGLCSAAPMGGSPCSAVLWHLRAVNALVHMQLNDWAGRRLLTLMVELRHLCIWCRPQGRWPSLADKIKRLVIFFI